MEQQHAQETSVERETSVEVYNSNEQTKMGNNEKMQKLNDRLLYVYEQAETRELQSIESKLEQKNKEFITTVNKITLEFKSKMEKTRYTNEEKTIMMQENTRLEAKVKERSQKLRTATDELDATKQSLHQYEKDIADKDLEIEELEGRIEFLKKKYQSVDEQSKLYQKCNEDLKDDVEHITIKQKQDQIRIDDLKRDLELITTLKEELMETGKSEHTIGTYLKEAKSEVQKLMARIYQNYEQTLKDYADQQRKLYGKKVDTLVQEFERRFDLTMNKIEETHIITIPDTLQNSYTVMEEMSKLKTENGRLYKQAMELQKGKDKLEQQIKDLQKRESVFQQGYSVENRSMIVSFMTKIQDIVGIRFVEDCQLTPEILVYTDTLSRMEQKWGIQGTEPTLPFDENLELPPVKTELMWISSAADGDENDKDKLDDEDEID